jgi:hypothetical protein
MRDVGRTKGASRYMGERCRVGGILHANRGLVALVVFEK